MAEAAAAQGAMIDLTAEDGHSLSAYAVEPAGPPRGGLVVVQEVFGVNHHIKAVADGFAGQGYTVIAPALFDRAERGVALGYGEADLARGRALRTGIGWDEPILDVGAAMARAAAAGPVAVIGYCWGGSVAFLAACRLRPAAAVCYYGGQIIQFKGETPVCPVQMHFGARDPIIPPDDTAAIRLAQPDAQIHVYEDAGHGFNCTERPDYHADCSALALHRTLAFLERHVG